VKPSFVREQGVGLRVDEDVERRGHPTDSSTVGGSGRPVACGCSACGRRKSRLL
jgi:hypothetical protein